MARDRPTGDGNPRDEPAADPAITSPRHPRWARFSSGVSGPWVRIWLDANDIDASWAALEAAITSLRTSRAGPAAAPTHEDPENS